MKGIFVLLALTLFLQGCAGPFSTYYHDRIGGKDITAIPTLIINQEEPRLFHGGNEEEDSVRMLEDGYAMVGYSSFNAGNVSESGAIIQAKKVHAAVVLLYSTYTNTVSGAMPLTLPNTQTSTTSLYGSAYGPGGYANYAGSAYTTTYGTKTTYIPYSVRRADYLATYCVKMKPPVFGTHVRDLTPEIRAEIGSNKGVLVNAVIKGSPAFIADILKSDILKKIGTIEIYDANTFHDALKKHVGEKVNILLIRGGETLEKEIQLNHRT